MYLMGKESFGKGIGNYFRKYEWSNATLSNFIEELQKEFKSDFITLQEWKKLWLETESTNILQPAWDISNKNPKAKIQINQSFIDKKFSVLRPHKIQVALFKPDMSYDVFEAEIGPQTEFELEYDGSKNYQAVMLNY